jgi:hypothetical protein
MSLNNTKLNGIIQGLRESGDNLGSVVLSEEAKTGSKIPSSHLNKIRKWTREDIDTDLIHTFPVIMIDTAPTRNLVIYTEASQKKSLKGWIGRTVLFNSNGSGNVGFLGQADHSLQAASQTARIYDVRMVKTPGGEIGTLGWFYAVEGVDVIIDSFIKKLNAGVLREVSIHVAVPEGIVCSIDDKPFGGYDRSAENEELMCFDHQPGTKYGRQTCYMSTGDGKLDPLELSAVAVPGSVNAHVLGNSEVENYQVVSLKEALGGSNQIKEQIMATRKNNKVSSADVLAEIANLAKNAGFLAEKKEDPADGDCAKCGKASHEGSCSASSKQAADPKQPKPAKAVKSEEEEEAKDEEEENGDDKPGNDRKDLKTKKGEAVSPRSKKPSTVTKDEEEEMKDEEEEEAADPKQPKPAKAVKSEEEEEERLDDKDDKKEEEEEEEASKESDPPEGDDDVKKDSKNKKASKQSFLFGDNCPACGGGSTQELSDSESVRQLREAYQEQIEIVIAAAKSKIASAKKGSKENSDKAEQYDALFDLFAQETATLAVSAGHKKSQERDKYVESLKSLSFNAVREIRESLSLNQNNSREDKVEVLRQSMMERSKQNLGTVVEETKDGKKKSSSGLSRRPHFGLK